MFPGLLIILWHDTPEKSWSITRFPPRPCSRLCPTSRSANRACPASLPSYLSVKRSRSLSSIAKTSQRGQIRANLIDLYSKSSGAVSLVKSPLTWPATWVKSPVSTGSAYWRRSRQPPFSPAPTSSSSLRLPSSTAASTPLSSRHSKRASTSPLRSACATTAAAVRTKMGAGAAPTMVTTATVTIPPLNSSLLPLLPLRLYPSRLHPSRLHPSLRPLLKLPHSLLYNLLSASLSYLRLRQPRLSPY